MPFTQRGREKNKRLTKQTACRGRGLLLSDSWGAGKQRLHGKKSATSVRQFKAFGICL